MIAIMDDKGLLNDGYKDVNEAIDDIPNVREENKIYGVILVIEILHEDWDN